MTRRINLTAVMCAVWCLAVGAAPAPKFQWDFAGTAEDHKLWNYRNYLKVEFKEEGGERFLSLRNDGTENARKEDRRMKETDNAWRVESRSFVVTGARPFALRIRARGTAAMQGPTPSPVVEWYGANGKPLMERNAEGKTVPMTYRFNFKNCAEAWTETVRRGLVPADAAKAVIKVQGDQPNVHLNEWLDLARVSYYEQEGDEALDFGDLEPPAVERVTKSPCADFSSPVFIRVSDASGVKRESVMCKLDGKDVTKELVWDGDVFTYRPAADWTADTLHEFRVFASDTLGNAGEDSAFICFTKTPVKHPVWSMRDDGTVLRDGKPFFPITISSVMKCPANGNDVDRGVRELRENGFNLVGTYLAAGSEAGNELYAACERHGMTIHPEPGPRTGADREKKVVANLLAGRGCASILGWETGDDTGLHRTPDEMRRDWFICRAVDPDALVLQSDICQYDGRYAPYAPWTDVFKVENYPIYKETPQADELPRMRKDLGFAFADLKRSGLRSRGIWSIVQSFVGWNQWKRYPTYEELRAMVYLALAKGIRGLAFYTYFSYRGNGITSSPERMQECFRVTREVSALSEDLLSRDAATQPKVKVRTGSEVDYFGTPSIICLLKESGLLIAVNTSTDPVTATFAMPNGETFDHSFERNGVFLHRMNVRKPEGVTAIRAVTPTRWDGGDDSPRYKRHLEQMKLVKAGGAKVVFLGDSITHGWEWDGKTAAAKYFGEGGFKMLNLGIGGDRTEHVLWRIENGQLDGYEAKVVVVMIGTNNTGHRKFADEPPADTILGIREILKRVHAKQPKAKIVLCPILPRGKDVRDDLRLRNEIVNKEIRKYADGRIVWWCDFGDQLLTADGRVSPDVMPDYLHPNEYGYEVWASAVLPYVTAALSDGNIPMPPNRYAAKLDPTRFRMDGARAAYPSARFNQGMVSFDQAGRKPDWWALRLLRNRNAIAASKGELDVVFLGDSITENWESPGRAQWAELAKTYRMLNAGYGGDTTEHLLWRLENGELEGYRAKVFVLMIGTNNHGKLADEAPAGIRRILDVIAAKQPQAKTLLIPAFPRAEQPKSADRMKNDVINAAIRPFADGKRVIWVDFGEKFLDANRDTKWIMPDRLHPGPKGYDIWVEALLPHFRTIIGK